MNSQHYKPKLPSRTIFCTEKKLVGRVSKLLKIRGLAVKEKKASKQSWKENRSSKFHESAKFLTTQSKQSREPWTTKMKLAKNKPQSHLLLKVHKN